MSTQTVKMPGTVEEIKGGIIYSCNTIGDLVTAGNYDLLPGLTRAYLNSENVQITHFGPRRLFIFHPDQETLAIGIEKHVATLPAQEYGVDSFAVANTPDLLIAGAFNQTHQLRFPIIAIGEPIKVKDKLMASCLSRVSKKRTLSLLHGNGPWSPHSRFLLVGCV